MRSLCIGIFLFCALVGVAAFSAPQASAETAAELREKITASKNALAQIEREIAQFQVQLQEVGAEKSTLQSAIRELELSAGKLQAEIRETQQKIDTADLEITELTGEIATMEERVAESKEAIATYVQAIDQLENESMVELLLAHETLADVWRAAEEYVLVSESLAEHVQLLEGVKEEREVAKNETEEKKKALEAFENELSGERSALETARSEKDALLSKTKNEEAQYQQLLAEKRAARVAFEKQVSEYESQLTFILNPSSIPAVGSGALRFPLETTLMTQCKTRASVFGNDLCLTQYFGNTAFAQSGAYNGKGHNGIDFGVPTGTKILSSLGGVVVETGDTDYHNGVRTACQSYGKWVLVRHGNGLSTLYAHLSSIVVSAGQRVETGQLLGYSGNTGYSTGPHLHFSVFASEGVSVVLLGDVKTVTSCGHERIPVAAFSAYLNPLDYL
jgi:murein DD-endopeptidase MepM/ murein hydrolase activator NlpD